MAEAPVITPTMLEDKIRANVESVEFVQAVDLSDGCGQKFEITVVSPVFCGLKVIAQHRMVNKAIEEERQYIHATTLKTKTPESWQSEQSEQQDAT
jgi:stress-induced morphogen